MVREQGDGDTRRAADDPRAPSGADRLARRRAPGRLERGCDRGRGIPSRRGRGALAGSRACATSDRHLARSSGRSSSAPSARLSRGRRMLSVPSPAHPRGRVRVDAEGDSERSCTSASPEWLEHARSSSSSTRSSATTSSRRYRYRTELDPAAPHLSGLAVNGIRSSRGGGAGGWGPRGLQRGALAVQAGGRDPSGRRSETLGARARSRARLVGVQRSRGGAARSRTGASGGRSRARCNCVDRRNLYDF